MSCRSSSATVSQTKCPNHCGPNPHKSSHLHIAKTCAAGVCANEGLLEERFQTYHSPLRLALRQRVRGSNRYGLLVADAVSDSAGNTQLDLRAGIELAPNI